jgi:hypothetical protein
VEQRFFLNRVNGYRRGLSIIKDVKDAAIVAAHPTNPELTRADNTTPLTIIAAYSGVRKLFIKQHLVHQPAPPLIIAYPHFPFRGMRTELFGPVQNLDNAHDFVYNGRETISKR